MIETMIELKSMDDVKTFVKYANMHKGSITLFSGKYIIDGKSIMGVFSLDLSKPVKIEIEGSLTPEVKDGIGKFIYKEQSC